MQPNRQGCKMKRPDNETTKEAFNASVHCFCGGRRFCRHVVIGPSQGRLPLRTGRERRSVLESEPEFEGLWLLERMPSARERHGYAHRSPCPSSLMSAGAYSLDVKRKICPTSQCK